MVVVIMCCFLFVFAALCCGLWLVYVSVSCVLPMKVTTMAIVIFLFSRMCLSSGFLVLVVMVVVAVMVVMVRMAGVHMFTAGLHLQSIFMLKFRAPTPRDNSKSRSLLRFFKTGQ